MQPVNQAWFAKNMPQKKPLNFDINRLVQGDNNITPLVTGRPYFAPASKPAPASEPTSEYAGDAYAQWGGQSGYNNVVSGFGNQKQNIFNTAGEAARNAGIGYKGSILDFIDSLRTGQQQIDNRGINNELARQRGTSDVLGMVGRGVRSGGVTLSNKNASDSSAAGAISRAYGDIGQRNLSKIGNQYEMENRDIDMAQQNFDQQERAGIRRITDSKEQTINGIVTEARNQLAALDAAMASASLPERIQIEQEKEAVRRQVLGELSQYDNMLTEETTKLAPMGADMRRAEATRLGSLGRAPASTFDYTTETPAQFQNTGPFASELPIFTYRNRRNS